MLFYDNYFEFMKELFHDHLEIGFTSEEKLVAFFKNDVTGSETSDVLLGVVFIDNFPNADQLATNITYKIRPKSQQKLDDDDVALLVDSEWYTNLMFPSDAGTSGPREEEYDEGGDPGNLIIFSLQAYVYIYVYIPTYIYIYIYIYI